MKKLFKFSLVIVFSFLILFGAYSAFATAPEVPTFNFTFDDNNGSTFEYPYGITADDAGNIYVADCGNTVSKFDSTGHFLNYIGDGTAGTTEGKFNCPGGVSFDSSGNVYVADNNNHRIQKFDSDGTFISTWGWGVATGVARYEICTSNCLVGLSGWDGDNDGAGGFWYPQGLSVDSHDNVYVADYRNRRIQKFDSDGTVISTWGWGVATGVARYEICTSNCQGGITGSGIGEFNSPTNISFDSLGNIYVTDDNNYRIQKFDSDGNFISMFGLGVQDGSNEYQVCTEDCLIGLEGDGDTSFSGLSAIGVDLVSNTIYIPDYGLGKIFRFDIDGNYIDSFGILGSDPGQFSDDIQGIHLANNKMYVADSDNARVQVFVMPVEIPALTTTTASSITTTTATLNGKITNNGGEDVTAGFEYGTEEGVYGDPIELEGTYTTDESFLTELTDLTCATTYYFIAYATNSEDTGYGDDMTFTTSDCPKERSHSRVIGSTHAVIAQVNNPQSNNVVQQIVNNPTPNTTPTLTVINIKRVLKLNIIGDDVKELQTWLNDHGYPLALTGPGSKSNETTKFGPLTKKAVIAFQKANGLVADGIVGPKTLEKMK